MNDYQKKEVAFERVLFFCDAVVAIAITLLALNLKINIPDNRHLTFADLVAPWHQYLAFILSFFNIAICWRSHHDFFFYIGKMNRGLISLNIWWLFFIVTLPFSTSLLSTHFGDTPAILFYSANIFIISILQNWIWDYAEKQDGFVDQEKLAAHPDLDFRITLMLNLDMINGLVAVIVSFFMPKTAFFLLFFKVPLLVGAAIFMTKKRRDELKKLKQ